MAKINLTAKRVARYLKQPGRYRDDDVRGLLLVVANPNNASWQLRYEKFGKEHWLGLGPVREFTLKEARERAREARQKLRDGIDPLEAKRAAKAQRALESAKALTFEQAATQYFDSHAPKWGNRKHRNQFLSTLQRYAFPTIGALPVSAIDTGLILKCLEPNWQRAAPTMMRVRGRIETVLDWATVRNYRSGDNPARWKGHLAEALPARAERTKLHHAALPYAELPAFMVELRAQEGVAARALEFLILTAARTGEILGATWDEIDFDNATWTVPASRMKMAKAHRVPLSPRAVELLRGMYTVEGNPNIFFGISGLSMPRLVKRMGYTEITVHGFRSAFSDWAHERTAYANHEIEASLAHAVGSGVERAYRRGEMFDKRRKLMDAWATYCASVPIKAGEVVPLRAS